MRASCRHRQLIPSHRSLCLGFVVRYTIAITAEMGIRIGRRAGRRQVMRRINSGQPERGGQYRPAAGSRLSKAALACLARMSRSSYVMLSGYRSKVADRSHR